MAVVVRYHPEWPWRFEQEAQALGDAFGDALIGIEHIGSTAVPLLCAKPILDMLGVATSLGAVDERTEAVAALGYDALGEYGIAGRRYFRKSDAHGRRSHHVHIFAAGALEIERHLALRDYLRAHPAVATEYASRKTALAGRGDYQHAKAPFVAATVDAAMAWRRGAGAD